MTPPMVGQSVLYHETKGGERLVGPCAALVTAVADDGSPSLTVFWPEGGNSYRDLLSPEPGEENHIAGRWWTPTSNTANSAE